MMSKSELENGIRNDILTAITNMLSEKMDTDVLPVSTSELAIPVVDAEGNEKFALIKVSIPRGTRNGNGYDPYDGYAMAEEYRMEQEDKNAKKAKRQAEVLAKEKEKEQKKEDRRKAKEAKEALAKLKETVKNIDVTE